MPEEKKLTRASRDKNYTDFECLELIKAVKKYVHIIEHKNQGTYKYKNEDRNAAWEAICREFNMRTSQNRTVAGLRVKWMCDKSNIRDYVQYLETSQSRSGRPPEEIPKPKFMSLIAEMIGAYCPALGPIPDLDEISLETPEPMVLPIKEEPLLENTDLPFEEIMVNDNSDQFNYNIDESSSMDSFHDNTLQNQTFHPPPAKRTRLSTQIPPSFQSNGISRHNFPSPATTNTNSEIHQLQIQLIKKQIEVQNRQIEVQALMAEELKVKIERTQQLMKIDAVESELRCKEMKKRIEQKDSQQKIVEENQI